MNLLLILLSLWPSLRIVVPLVFVGLISSFSTSAQVSKPYLYDVSRYTIKDGLPDSTIYTLEQDKNGFLWLGTPNGIARYDGHHFEVFRNNTDRNLSLLSENAGNIFIDSKQQLWIGSWGEGLFLYDENLNLLNHFTHTVGEQQSICSDFIQLIIEDSEGDIWIGTNGGGLSMYNSDAGTFRHFKSDDEKYPISHDRVWDIVEGAHGQIWVATGGGLDVIDKKDGYSVRSFTHDPSSENSIPHPRVRALLFEQNGDLWIGTESGLSLMKKSSNRFVQIQPENELLYLNSAITSLSFGKDNELWIGTQRGLFLYDKGIKKFNPLVSAQQLSLLSNDDVRDLIYDPSGILWVASRPSGLIKITFPKDSFERYTQFFDESGRTIEVGRAQALLMDKDDNLWIGASLGLRVLRAGEKNIESFETTNGINPGLFTSIVQQQDGTVWFGGNRGLFRLSEDSGSLLPTDSLWPDNENTVIESLFVDSRNQLWIGSTHKGLFRFDGREIVRQPLEVDGLTFDTHKIASIAEDRNGYILVGTNGYGVLRFSPYSSGVQRYSSNDSPNSLSNNQVNQVHLASDNNIWVATTNRLNKLDDISNTFTVFDERHGLSNTTIKSIEHDQKGNIWFGTAFGLFRLSYQSDTINHFTDAHGLHGNQFIARSSTKGNHGELYFGGGAGFSRVNVDGLDESVVVPKIILSKVEVDESSIAQLSFSQQEILTFPHTIRDLKFSFSDLDFHSLESGTYSHRLIGHNADWSSAHSSNSVTYSGLPPGNYRFEVRSQHTGHWSPDAAVFNFDILPPWWKSWWVNSLLVLCFILAVHIWNKWRLAKLTYRNEALEREVAARSEQLVLTQRQLVESEKNASLSSLVTGVAHEINTPIGVSYTASSLLVEKSKELVKKFHDNKIKRSEFESALESIKSSSELVFNNVGRAADLVTSFKALSVDQRILKKQKINLKNYIDEVFSTLMPSLRQRSIAVEINCPANLVLYTYSDLLTQMLSQLSVNAMEHGFADRDKGNIRINIQQVGDRVHLHFADDGRGIPEELQARVFEPFFTTRRQDGGTGLGLQVVANIVTISLEGKISFTSDHLHGTVFNIEFPVLAG